MSEDDRENKRRALGRLSCVSLSSSTIDEEINWVMQFYYQEGLCAPPRPAMRPHIFNILDFWTPRIVLTPHLVKLGVDAPLHPHFRAISEWFDIAPIQLPPNSYRLAIAMYIMYVNKGFPPPSMEELSHFLSLRKLSRKADYFYFAVFKSYNDKGFNHGRINNVKNWKDSYFYVFNIDRARTQFNDVPSKACCPLTPFPFFFFLLPQFTHPSIILIFNLVVRLQTQLRGAPLDMAHMISNLPAEKKDVRALTSRKNLVKYGFLSDQIGSLVQYKKFHKGRIVKPKTNKEGAEYWSDSEDKDSEGEKTNTDINNS